ncbi:Kinesin-like protein costa [Ooceraea biroi]|uniref:Kinesin-like protein costa n=1 Tax=Ooceraea biroi TaxID=2015173 RepID=A0A026WQN1_OOCBI|nr:Kinesin-like protein costa [Ooceraea biroi]
MMDYSPYIHHQAMLDNQQCYTPYIDTMAFYHQQQRDHERHHLTEEESEQIGDEAHEMMTPATSGERSSSADLFRLEFAAAQWSKLVSNAEGLFTKLMTSNVLPHTDQDQIEQWLCMKQEYEECIANDDNTSLQGYPDNMRRSLERIEEVTETDEKTDESANQMKLKMNPNCISSSESELSEAEDDDDEDDEDEEEDNSDASSENPDFLDKLDEYINKFKIETDGIVDSKKDDFRETNIEIISSVTKSMNNNYVPVSRPARNPNSRRNSMLPGSDMCNEVLVFNDSLKPCQNQILENHMTDYANSCVLDNHGSEINDNFVAAQNDNSPDLLLDALNTDVPEPVKELKALTLNNEAKQTQVKKIQSNLDGAHKRIEELQTTINIKQRFIADMIKNSDTRTNAKQKFQRKRSKLEEEYYNTRTQLAQAENASMYKDSDEKSAHKKEIELMKNMAIHYGKRLMDIDMIKQIAGDSAKKVLELEASLNTSKKQMDKLKRQLKREEERKKQLEEELAKDQQKIRELEEKYNLTASKLKEMQSESEDEKHSLAKSKIDCADKKKNLLDVSARISHLDHVLKEKSMDLERTADMDEKEALRHEIRNLRHTRDCLVDEKCDLDEKLQKERTLTTVEERKLLECGETIEAIDAMIEHKNEMICGRKDFDENQSQREKGERMLTERLKKLSHGEIITLFMKYFRKVIDLKESSKNLEVQTSELEALISNQEWRLMDSERRMVLLQRQYEDKLHHVFRHFAEETSNSGHERLDKDSELIRYRRENRMLKKRLADVEALFKGTSLPRATSPCRIPQQGLKQIAANTQSTTKVTRQRNKLIIQKTTDCDKRKK